MGGVVAEALRLRGLTVTLVTPAGEVSSFAGASLEQPYIQRQLLEGGIEIVTQHTLARIDGGRAILACVFTGRETRIDARSVVSVTARTPDDSLYRALADDPAMLEKAGIRSLARIGDCVNPGTIAAAVHAGHRHAREFESPPVGDLSFRVEHIRHTGGAARQTN
jgi:dimethylamine/trimethylamine dehydrogenase